MNKWEYKRLIDPSEIMLNKLGSDGWEVVAVAQKQDPISREYYLLIVYLKRKINTNEPAR